MASLAGVNYLLVQVSLPALQEGGDNVLCKQYMCHVKHADRAQSLPFASTRTINNAKRASAVPLLDMHNKFTTPAA